MTILFCDNSSFFNEKLLLDSGPNLTDCFRTIVPAVVPLIWLVLTGPFYIYSLVQTLKPPVPLTSFSFMKCVFCCLLVVLCIIDIIGNRSYGYRCDENRDIPGVFYLSVVVQILCFVFVAIATEVNRRKGVITSWVLWIFWLLSVICSIIPLTWNITKNPSCGSSIAHYLLTGVLVIQLVLYSIADNPFKKGYEHIGKEECPELYSSIVSKASFWWFNSVVIMCYKKTITKDDLWDQLPSFKAEKVINEMEVLFQEQAKNIQTQRNLQQSKSSNDHSEYAEIGPSKDEEMVDLSLNDYCNNQERQDAIKYKPSLFKCVIQLYGCEWLRACFLKAFSDVAVLSQPLILALIVEEVELPTEKRINWYCVFLAISLFVVGQLQMMFYLHSEQRILRLSLKVKTALIGMIYHKVLRVSNSVKQQYTTGEIVSLVSVECQRVQDAFAFSQELLSFFLIMIFGLYELWNPMGISFLGCLGAILTIFFLHMLFGKLQQDYFEEILSLKGKRIKVFNEVIKGIKIVKMYTWEPFFIKKIKQIRLGEIAVLRKIARVASGYLLTADHSQFFMNFVMVLIYTFVSSHPYSAKRAFQALSIINILRMPLQLIPYIIGGLVQAVVSLGRIQSFLWSHDIDKLNVVQLKTNSDDAVIIKDGSFKWDKNSNHDTLSCLNTNIVTGKLVAVVGLIGSGKSSLLSSILGEMERVTGTVYVNGSVSYVTQEAWIQNMTIKDNILYGKECDNRKYKRIIKNCCLKQDLKILSAGDMTEIGEQGINISGGQKQRINLARAVYCDSDIYLLDDPLSAVDSHVGQDLFNNVIGPAGILKSKTRILVTHHVHWLPKVDEIIVMDNGTISEQGTFQELVAHDGPFAKFLKQYFSQESSDEEDPEIEEIKDAIFDQIEMVTSEGLTSEGFTSDGLTSEDERGLSTTSNGKMARRRSRRIKDGAKLTRQLSAKLKRSESVQAPDETVEPQETDGTLIQDELAKKGSVKFSVLWAYFKSMGICLLISAAVFLVIFQGLGIYSNVWITHWTSNAYLRNASLVSTDTYYSYKTYYLGMYALIGILQGVAFLIFQICLTNSFVHATSKIHSTILNRIFHSPMSFFHTTPIGRIINRFSSDIDVLDDRFPRFCNFFIVMFSTLLSTVVVIVMETPLVLAVITPVTVLYVVCIRLYVPTTRQLKRIEAVTRSPILSFFSETICGSSVIRAYRSQERFIQDIYKRIDSNSLFYFAANTGMGWIGIRIETFGNLIVLATGLFVALSTTLSGAEAGLSLTYALQMITTMNAVVQTVSMLQMDLISIERVEEYTHLEPEASWTSDGITTSKWYRKGDIQFIDYKTRYRPGLDLVLRGVSCDIKGGEKIGVVGRTGAGKSSLTVALFRLIERADGCIKIDGIDIADLGLHDLRSQITILPQDPVIFSEPLRTNLDPTEQFTDADIWRAIEYAHLEEYVVYQKDNIWAELGESGSNLSVGQRQLVCLARALLHKTKILILDEATAAVDMETDSLIQQTIKAQFPDCTIISIAHRINTIIDYDRVMVMDNGIIAEFDTPSNLLQNTGGLFFALAKEASIV